jgi:hypothetical protein
VNSVHRCSNGRSLIISRKNEAIQALANNDISPSVVLMTAWTQESAKSEQLLIQRFLQLGCKYFVCAGRYAEDLHDFIDGLIEVGGEQSASITTTYHDGEPADLVTNFFVNATDMSNHGSGGLVAILNDDFPEDALFKDELLRA